MSSAASTSTTAAAAGVDVAALLDAAAPQDPTLVELLEKKTLKWIFVGGKGGVGKTTCSCMLAIQLAKRRRNVLLVSTDPAHNLSDAFEQQFTKEPLQVAGFDNLFAMEVDAKMDPDEFAADAAAQVAGGAGGGLAGMAAGMMPPAFKEMMQSMPGVDEAMSFMHIIRLVQELHYDAIVFDTAPTGHTLRLLEFPKIFRKSFGSLLTSKDMGGLMQQVAGMLGMPNPMAGGAGAEERGEQTQQLVEDVERQFKDPKLTTFVCVCIPEFLSVYETERLVQELNRFEIDASNIVVNQVVARDTTGPACELCVARENMQRKYLDQIAILYDLFHVVKLPLQKQEIRGKALLEPFSRYLVEPHPAFGGSG